MKKTNKFPKGWTAKRVKSLAAHYDNQTQDAAVAEDEAAYENIRTTMMAVPVKLVPKVQQLINRMAG